MPKKCWPLLLLIALLTGCAPVDSLNPVYTDKDVIFDRSLVGDWVSPHADEGEKKYFRFVAVGPYPSGLTGYRIFTVFPEDNEQLEFEGYLINLQGQRFLDVIPQSWAASTDFYTLNLDRSKNGWTVEPHLIKLAMAGYMEFSGGVGANHGQLRAQLRPAHWFLKVTTDGQKLRLDWIDDDVLKEAIEQGRLHVGSAILDDDGSKHKNLVITAPTTELRKFVLDHVNDDSVFSASAELQRRPVSPSVEGAKSGDPAR